MRAQELEGVKVIRGNFKTKMLQCQATCKEGYTTYEEKETDVNIALFLIDLAYRDEFDRCLLLSGDSDLVPAARLLKERFPEKTLTLVLPPLGRKRLTRDKKPLTRANFVSKLRQIADESIDLIPQDFRRAQLPDAIPTPQGGVIINPYSVTAVPIGT